MKLKDLAPHPDNPRKISGDQLGRLQKSLKEFGDLSGIVFNRQTGRLIGGHQRLKVLPADLEIRESESGNYIEAGGDRFQVRYVDWDETKEKAANIAANQHGGDWDYSRLSDWLIDLQASNIDMDLTGFSEEQLEKICAPDLTPIKLKETTCPKCGHIWTQGERSVQEGDS